MTIRKLKADDGFKHILKNDDKYKPEIENRINSKTVPTEDKIFNMKVSLEVFSFNNYFII